VWPKNVALFIYISTHYFEPLLNSLTSIDTFSWLGGPVVTPKTAVQEVPGSIPVLARIFMFAFLCPKHIFVNFFNSLCNVNSFNLLLLPNLWWVIRVPSSDNFWSAFCVFHAHFWRKTHSFKICALKKRNDFRQLKRSNFRVEKCKTAENWSKFLNNMAYKTVTSMRDCVMKRKFM